MIADTTGFPASLLHGEASDGTCDPSEMVDIFYMFCVLSWEKGPGILRNFHDLLQNEEPLTWHRATSVFLGQ